MSSTSTLKNAKMRLTASLSKLGTIRGRTKNINNEEEKFNEKVLFNIDKVLEIKDTKLIGDNNSDLKKKVEKRDEIISDLEKNLRELNSYYSELINKNHDKYLISEINLSCSKGEIDELNVLINHFKDESKKLEENNNILVKQILIKDDEIKRLNYNFERKDVNLNVFFNSLKFVNFHKKTKLYTLLIIDSSRVFLPNYFDFIFEWFTGRIINDFDVKIPTSNQLFWSLFGFFIIFSFLSIIYTIIRFVVFSFFNFFLKWRGFGSNELKKWKDFPKIWKKDNLKNLEIKKGKNK